MDVETIEPVPNAPHRSVLLRECLELLTPEPGHCVLDCTLGAGGHSAAFIERIGPGGHLIGLDADPEALQLAREKLEPIATAANVTIHLIHANFSEMLEQLANLNLPPPNVILADLGVSSMQFDKPERGFSFRFDHPLDMRMDPRLPHTAADILREYREDEIADVLFKYGGEHKSRRIARAIVMQRKQDPVRTTGQLEELVRRALRVRGWRHTHPATKTFQALRIAVNHEFEALATLLEQAPEALCDNGALGIITFHSLEDREVKQRFKALALTGRFQQIVKFVRPGDEELEENPRSRSAKLRAVRKTPR